MLAGGTQTRSTLAEEIAKGKKLAADQSAFGSQAHHGPWLMSSSAVPGPD